MAQHLAAGSTAAVRIKVREDSARPIVDKIKEIAGELPVIIMGDYNCGEGSSPYEIFVDSGFHDSSHMNPTAAFRGTYSGWSLKADGTPAKDMDKSVPIDLIMLSEDDFAVNRYAVFEEVYEGIQVMGIPIITRCL